MTLQGGDDRDAPSGAAKLDLDEADQLAASFRPAWEVEEEAPPAMNAASTQILGSGAGVPAPGPVDAKGVTLPLGVRPAAPSAEALDSANVIEVAPAVAPAAPPAPAALNKTVPLAASPVADDPNRTQPAKPVSASPKAIAQPDPFGPAPSALRSSRPPAAAAPVPIRRPVSAVSTDELDAMMPKKSKKGLVFGIVGVGIAVGLGLFLKFALSEDPPPAKSSTTSAAPTTPANEPAKNADIPPPPSPDEMPAPTAAAKPATKPETTKPAEAAPSPKPVEAAPKPAVAVRETPKPASRPAPAAAPQPKAAPEPPKTAPKPPQGGIVRDSPF